MRQENVLEDQEDREGMVMDREEEGKEWGRSKEEGKNTRQGADISSDSASSFYLSWLRPW